MQTSAKNGPHNAHDYKPFLVKRIWNELTSFFRRCMETELK